MRPDVGPGLLDPEVEVPVIITVELLHAAGCQPVQPGQQLLGLGLTIGNLKERNKLNNAMQCCFYLIKTGFDYFSWFEDPFRHGCGYFVETGQLVICLGQSQSSCTFTLQYQETYFLAKTLFLVTHILSTNKFFCLYLKSFATANHDSV